MCEVEVVGGDQVLVHGEKSPEIGAVYYLRIIALMYLRPSVRPLPVRRALPGLVALAVCLAVTLVAGIYPEVLWEPVRAAIPRGSPPAVQVTHQALSSPAQ